MYSKPIYFKLYSIISFVLSVIGTFSTVICWYIFLPFIENFLNDPTKIDMMPVVKVDISFYTVFIGIAVHILFFVFLIDTYMNCSSMFAFSGLLSHERKGNKQPVRSAITLPPAAYRNYGTVVLIIFLAIAVVEMLVYIFTTWAIPVIPLLITAVVMIFVYVTYYVKFEAVSALMEAKATASPSNITKSRINECSTGVLRGFCYFCYGLCFVVVIGALISIIAFTGQMSAINPVFGISFVISSICSAVIGCLALAVNGLYFDNVAKMVEHYQIEYSVEEE